MRLIDADLLFDALENAGWYDNKDKERAQDILLDQPSTCEWISVKDRMPQECENVLCYDGDLGVINVCWFSGEVVQWTDGEFVDIHVTHWMPLPEPPDEGDPF